MVERVGLESLIEGASVNLGEHNRQRLPQWAAPWFGLGVGQRPEPASDVPGVDAPQPAKDVPQYSDAHHDFSRQRSAAALRQTHDAAAGRTVSGTVDQASPEQLQAVAQLGAVQVRSHGLARIDAAVRDGFSAARAATSSSASDSATGLEDINAQLDELGRHHRQSLRDVLDAAQWQLGRGAEADRGALSRLIGDRLTTVLLPTDEAATAATVATVAGQGERPAPPLPPFQITTQPGSLAGAGHSGLGAVIVTDASGAPVTDLGGAAAGHLDLLNEALPQALRALTAVGAASGDETAGVALAHAHDAGDRQTSAASPASSAHLAAYLSAQTSGAEHSAPVISLAAGAIGSGVDAAGHDAQALRPVVASAAMLGTVAGHAAELLKTEPPGLSSHPAIATTRSEPTAPAATVSLRVLSVAQGPLVGSEPVNPDQVLGGGGIVTLGLQIGQESTDGTLTPLHSAVIKAGPAARLADVATAVNLSGLAVQAQVVAMSTDSAQLQVRSLVTGRMTQITVTDGGVPPSAATVLGRFSRLESGTDTLALVDGPTGAPSLAISSTTEVAEIAPGVTLQVHGAEPETAVTVTDGGSAERLAEALAPVAGAVERLEGSVGRAAGQGLSAGALSDVTRLLSAVRRDIAGLPGGWAEDAGGPITRETRALAAAFREDSVGAREQAGAALRRVEQTTDEAAAQRMGYLALRVQADPAGELTDYASSARRESAPGGSGQHQPELTALLGRLSAQNGWLRSTRS